MSRNGEINWRVSLGTGFTLIELLVVLAAIGLLLAVVAPVYVHHVDRARELALRQDLKTVRDAIDKFRADNAKYPDNLQELVDSHYLSNFPEDPITERSDTWVLVQGDSNGVRDIHSGSDAKAADGSVYKAW